METDDGRWTSREDLLEGLAMVGGRFCRTYGCSIRVISKYVSCCHYAFHLQSEELKALALKVAELGGGEVDEAEGKGINEH